MKKAIICGSRSGELSSAQKDWLCGIVEDFEIAEIITGGQTGIDTCAYEWAGTVPGLGRQKFKADWNQYGLAAGPIRNRRMAKYVGIHGILIVFPGGIGTASMVRIAKEENLVSIIYAPVLKG